MQFVWKPQAKPKNSETKQTLPTRTRQRAILSCDRCHRFKVKCDRGVPCGRCERTGQQNDCRYRSSNLHQPSNSQTPGIGNHNVTGWTKSVPCGNCRRMATAVTHWAILTQEVPHLFPSWDHITIWLTHIMDQLFEEAAPFVFRRVADFDHIYRGRFIENSFLSKLPTNHIRGKLTTNISSRRTLSCLPPHGLVVELINNYLYTFEQVYPLLEKELLVDQVSTFFLDPATCSEGWISQFLMILSLSCHSAHPNIAARLDGRAFELAASLFDAAHAETEHYQFMSVPDLTTIRTLCMMVLARRIGVASQNNSTNLLALMALVIRMAMSMGLNLDPDTFPEISTIEADSRRHIWMTIVFLDLHISLEKGLPNIIRPEDYTTRAPVEEATGQYGSNNDSDSFRSRLSKLFPVASAILHPPKHIRSSIGCDEVAQYDRFLRDALPRLDVPVNCVFGMVPHEIEQRLLQNITLEIFTRSVLLSLHYPFSRIFADSQCYEASFWAVLECSLAILRLQNSLYSLVSHRSQGAWLMDIFKVDFGIAVIHVSLALRRGCFSIEIPSLGRPSAKETAWHTLLTSTDAMKNQVDRSATHSKIFSGSMYLVAALQAIQSSDSILRHMELAEDTIIAAVRSRLLDTHRCQYGAGFLNCWAETTIDVDRMQR